MNEQVISREELALDADAAAQRFVQSGVEQDCPYVSGTEAHREWRASYQRSLLKWSAPEAEASA